MTPRPLLYAATALLLTTTAHAQEDRPEWATKPAAIVKSVKAPVAATETEASDVVNTGWREVTASRDVILVKTRLRLQTLILLPSDDEVLDVLNGDAGRWVTSTTRNIVHVKPADVKADTNMNLVMASGAVYTFFLRVLRDGDKDTPDLKLYVKAPADVAPAPRKWVAAAELDAVQAQLIDARAQVDRERQRGEEQITAAKQQATADLKCDYNPVPNVKPFFVQSICRSETHTYIRSGARELPALYEVKDGEPSILNYQVENGLYVVPKVLEKAYLAIGKKSRLPFTLKGDGN